MSKKDNKKNGFLRTGNWLTRMFMGADKQYTDEKLKEMEEAKNAAQVSDVEEIVSPTRQIINNFFSKRLAVGALIFLISMFLFVLIAPKFMPTYTDSYTEVTQKSVEPGLDMMSVPKELEGDIKDIDSWGSFSVGLSNSGKVYVWGATKLGTTKIDIADIPEDVQNAKIEMIAAGIDHIIAIDENGKIHGWGYNRFGQYSVDQEILDNPNIAAMPEEIRDGIDVSKIKKLTAGYQCTAILMEDGTLYVWGNKLAYANIDKFLVDTKFKDIDFTLNYVVGIPERANGVYTGQRGLYDQVKKNVTGETKDIGKFLGKRKIEEIETTNSNICLRLDDNSICFIGDFSQNDKPAPTLPEGEYFVDIGSGTYHYAGITNKGNVYSWGGNTFGQSNEPKDASGASKLFVGAFQNYTVDANNKLVSRWGLKGYLFGTDTYGADVFKRIVNGGKMTMTIGAVAVIISSIIGIMVGCIAGYFGGKVDILLMRITEIVSAIPFIPFAMILSAIMAQMTLSENMRIFIIMCILGVLSWTGIARLVRGQVLVARENEYVLAAQAMGVKESKIAFKHILPNIISVIMVNLTLNFASCMLTESSLSYLGFGVAYPKPTWGNMLNGANNATVIGNYWWQWVFTALFLALTTICINILGDALRDVMDPKSNIEK